MSGFVWWGYFLSIFFLPQVVVFGAIFGAHLRRSLGEPAR